MIWFRRKATGLSSPHPQLRDALLAQVTLATLADRPNDDPDTPFARFHAAQAAVQVGDRAQARRHLHELLQLPALATRDRLQAWSCLRDLDELPAPAAGALVRGVAVDFGTSGGLDTLAAYDDRTAWLVLHGGVVATATGPDGAVDEQIAALLGAARGVVQHTDPHRGHREHPPEAGHACIHVLTFAGTHIGLGPVPVLERDPVGGPVLQAAAALRAALPAQPTFRA